MTTLEKLSNYLMVTAEPRSSPQLELLIEAKAEIERLEKENLELNLALIVAREPIN